VLIKNILTFIFSAVLIDFDRKFIDSQGLLYVTGGTTSVCSYSQSNSNGDNGGYDYTGTLANLAKGELAASVIMLVSALVFVAIFIYVYIRALRHDRNMPNNYNPSGNYPTPIVQPKINDLYNNRRNVDYQPGPILCENCGATVIISNRF
jgi:hypothetical protein